MSRVGSEESFLKRHGNPSRGRHAGYAFDGGQPRAKTRLAQPCPTCQAEPGQPCRRWVGGRVCGADVGGSYWRTLTTLHQTRRVGRGGAPERVA